jgi:hypothetical protein
MKNNTRWLLAIIVLVGVGTFYVYQKDKKNAASSATVGSTNNTVLPNTSTTSVPAADSTWNPAYRISNQRSTVNQAMS